MTLPEILQLIPAYGWPMCFIMLQMTGHVYLKSYVELLEKQIADGKTNEARAFAVAEESHSLTKQVLEQQKASDTKMIANHQASQEQKAAMNTKLDQILIELAKRGNNG